LGKIAVDLDRALARRAASGAPGRPAGRLLARGEGWSAEDVICTSGPADRPFEEWHADVAIAAVVAGSFQYRSSLGRDLMMPGSLLLGNADQHFECSHEHATGDRCVAFRYTPDYFERLAADAGARGGERTFRAARVPPLPQASALVAQAATGVAGGVGVSWEEIAIAVAVTALRLSAGLPLARTDPQAAAVARVTESVRAIARHPGARWTLRQLAADARQSPFHYLRTFEHLTGVTPHQFILRTRLREAATRLVTEDAKVIEIALAAGFGDISNFNRSFRVEFGVAPQVYRRRIAPEEEMQPGRRDRARALMLNHS
jgi:AraC family transcriptional regulator